MHSLADHRILRPTQTALALKLVTEMDLLRLTTIARLHARGLPPDVGWEDLLQEAITRVLTGARRTPKGVPVVAFLAGIMRSLKSEHWRRSRGRERSRAEPARDPRSSPTREAALREAAPDPERSLIAMGELKVIERLFADDPVVLGIIDALGEGLTAELERILEAANDLGMKPGMKGSAAFLGLRYPAAHRPEDYFDPQWMLR